jgi:tetratricopeptide (TPR) repeat protein
VLAASTVTACANRLADDRFDRQVRAEAGRTDDGGGARTGARLLFEDLRAQSEGQTGRHGLCLNPEDERPQRPGACRDAQGGHRSSERQGTCLRPTARRWPAPASSRQALDAIQRAQDPTQPDWRLLSAEGAIYDQTGRSAEARQLYKKALTSARRTVHPVQSRHELPAGRQPATGGEPICARPRNIRPQTAACGRTSHLVVGLQGRFDEAEQIARRELSPQQAEANVAYLRGMLAQQNAWNLIKQEDKKKTGQQ